jgi:hypothetical protein
VADLSPKQKKRIAQFLRLLSSKGGERRNAYAALERFMQSEGITWSDIGNAIEQEDGKYTEEEMLEMVAIVRKEEQARAPQRNGHIMLPEPSEMADYCYANRGRLEEKHHSFIDKMSVHRGRRPLSLKQKGYLASLYIQLGGRT